MVGYQIIILVHFFRELYVDGRDLWMIWLTAGRKLFFWIWMLPDITIDVSGEGKSPLGGRNQRRILFRGKDLAIRGRGGGLVSKPSTCLASQHSWNYNPITSLSTLLVLLLSEHYRNSQRIETPETGVLKKLSLAGFF